MLNKDFLKQLDQEKHKEIFIKIITLDVKENPIEQIEGRITGGSINVDGASAIRRTCSISMVTEDKNIQNFYLGLNTKFKLEIGLRNQIDSNYPDIIWFKQGTFIKTSMSLSQSTNSFQVEFSAKDKMCLLNGEVNGAFTASINFGEMEEISYTYDEVDFTDRIYEYTADSYYVKINENYHLSIEEYGKYNNETYSGKYYEKLPIRISKKIPIKQIIKEMVHAYAGEPYYNIIINDLEDYGLELLEYNGDTPIYLVYGENNNQVDGNIIFNENRLVSKNSNFSEAKPLKEYKDNEFANFIDGVSQEFDPFYIREDNGSISKYYISRCKVGDVIGYRLTDLTYPKELIAKPGETITTILDNIVKVLGDFQYYYDLDGRFIFELKDTYLNISWNSIVNTKDDVYAKNAKEVSKFAYNFENSNLISSFQNSPNINNIKNDYSVFGERETLSGQKVPVHARIAIHKKPRFYKSFDAIYYISKDCIEDQDLISLVEEDNSNVFDWRELIYQMSLDYLKHGQEDDFYILLNKNNTLEGQEEYPQGITSYEQYYVDMEAFWRELYDPEPQYIYEKTGGVYEEVRTPLDDSNVEGAFVIENKWVDYKKVQLGSEYFTKEDNNELCFWNKKIIEAPEQLNFWIDFLDPDSYLGQFSHEAIGVRSKVVNDNDVKSIYNRNIPNIIFINNSDEVVENITGYNYINFPNQNYQNYFKISAQGKTAKDEIDSLLYQHTFGNESVNITSIPIYYLDVNTRISIYDDYTGINNEYIVQKISYSLNYNGTMTIQGAKAPRRLL